MMKHRTVNERPYVDSHMPAMVRNMIDKAVSEIFETVNFEIHLGQTIEDIVSSPWCVVKVTEVLFDTDELLDPVSHVVKNEANRVIETSSRREKRMHILARAAERTVSVR